MSGALSPTHWVIIIAVFALLFGARKLPEAARGVGQAMRIFKAEVSELHDDRRAAGDPAPPPPGAGHPPVTPPPAQDQPPG